MGKILNQKEKILEELYSFHRAGIKPGLKRTQLLLDRLENPQSKLKLIHVAGTNGKGSVCSMLSSVLMEAGYKVGLYTSPHLIEFNERIRINGVNISDNDMIPTLEQILPMAKELDSTFFEITTALAFEYFKQKEVDFAVIETGMGGRFDSTNVIYPILTIITQIDLDHQEFLGNSLEKIAQEKAGIFKPKVPIIISDNNPNLKDVFLSQAERISSPIFFTEEWFQVNSISITPNMDMKLNISDGFTTFNDLILSLAGLHQVNNLKAVLSAFNFMKNDYNLTEEHLRLGLKNTKINSNLFGRIEILSQNPLIILDVSHNPAGSKRLAETLSLSEYKNTKFNVLFGVMADKDIKSMLGSIKNHCKNLVITRPQIDRASSLEQIESIAKSLDFQNIQKIEEISSAINHLTKINEPILIVGSFYTASEAIISLKQSNNRV